MQPNDLARALSREWQSINEDVFGGALLEPPSLEISDQITHRLGDWNPELRRIRISLGFATERPWWAVLEVLKHEMAHQYVSDVLGIDFEETSHGPAFRMVCERYGIDGRSGHKPTDEELRIVEKARKLLALSASPNEHEAHAALSAVQQLLGRHGLTEEDISERGADELGVVRVGAIVSKCQRHHSIASAVLGSHFRVRGIWLHTGDPRDETTGLQLELVGRRSDLAMASYVHDWLHSTAERMCPDGLSKRERLDFLAGFMAGHARHLADNAVAARAQASGNSTSMVPARLEADLDDYFHRRHPRTRSLRGSRRQVTASFHEGERAGRSATMNRPIEGGGLRLLKGKAT